MGGGFLVTILCHLIDDFGWTFILEEMALDLFSCLVVISSLSAYMYDFFLQKKKKFISLYVWFNYFPYPCVQVQHTWVGQKIQGLCHRLVRVRVEWQSTYRIRCHGMEGSSSGLLEGNSEGASSCSRKQVMTKNKWLFVVSTLHLYVMKFYHSLISWVLGMKIFCNLKCLCFTFSFRSEFRIPRVLQTRISFYIKYSKRYSTFWISLLFSLLFFSFGSWMNCSLLILLKLFCLLQYSSLIFGL